MTLFGYQITPIPPATRLLTEKELSERELEEVFWQFAPSHPCLRAVLQLIAANEARAHQLAEDDRSDRDSHVGTARACRLLREEIFARHDVAVKKRAKQDS